MPRPLDLLVLTLEGCALLVILSALYLGCYRLGLLIF